LSDDVVAAVDVRSLHARDGAIPSDSLAVAANLIMLA